jgi:tetratricopeptide (TPR) repeat protein
MCPHVALGQATPVVSRPVVQSLPSGESRRLSAALARIARDPRDFSALMEAGDAANAMGDPEASVGFYKRADSIAPNNPRIKAGLARALVLQGKPVEAITLFASADAAGAAGDVTSDRGLAYDLVGDPVTAQRYYQTALARRDDDEVRRRLGISLAIIGDATASDAMLMPLLRKQDKPAWRAHAFALAIAGKTKEAVDTVNAILPGPLAQSVTPYLRYMPRLTRAQQAAAVNLGKFPRASEIGQDDPTIIAFAANNTRMASADSLLIPRGKPLGSGGGRSAGGASASTTPLTAKERRARDKAARLARTEAAQAARVAPPEPMPAIDRDGELPALAASTPMTPPSMGSAVDRNVIFSNSPTQNQPERPRVAARLAEATPASPSRQVALPAPATAIVRAGTLELPSFAARPPASAPATAASPVQATREPARGTATTFDLARVESAPASRSGVASGGNQTAAVATSQVSGTATSGAALSLEQAFADLGSPSRAPAPIAGAVDVRAITPVVTLDVVKPEPVRARVAKDEGTETAAKKAEAARLADVDTGAVNRKKTTRGKDAKLAEATDEASTLARTKKGDKKAEAKKADAKKAAPSHPSRIWVQVGVGRDKGAIGYDWRKFVKANPTLFKGREPSISDMGRTNRILLGPFENQKEASELTAKLKKGDVAGAFVWSSPAGQAVDPLPVK